MPMLLILAGMGWVAYKQGLPRYRHFAEKQYSRQAWKFMINRDFSRAFLRARQSLAINSKNPVATQVIADLADMAGSPYAIYWRQRAELLAPTVTNQLALASTALKLEPFPYSITAKTLDEITPENQSTVTYHLIAGALAVKLDNFAEAEQNYAAAVKIRPGDPASQMSLAVVRLQSQNPRLIADARTTLETLDAGGKLGLLPLRSLVAESMARQDFDRAEQLSSNLMTNSQALFGDRMLHLAILHAARRPNFQAFLKDTEQRASQNPVYIGELGTWLNQFGYATESLAWLQGLPTSVRHEELVPLVLADSYISLKRWNDLESYLEGEQWPGMEYIRIAMLAFAIRNESERADYDVVWQRAVGLASKSPASLNLLAQLAASWSWKAEAGQVLWQAVDNFPNQDWPLVELKNLYIAQKDTKNLRRVFQIEFQRHPADKFAENNYAMLSLLLGEDTWTAHQYAAELHASAPDNPTFTSTYAFSLYLQGKTKQGIAVLQSLKPEDLSRPGTAAYYGILLAADGQVQAARDCFAKSTDAFLLPEEMALVRSAKRALPGG
jgi:Flp pilus assembly protein TadD